MQPSTATTRAALNNAPALTVRAGADLLDADNKVIGDLTGDLVAEGSSVSSNSYGDIHRRCQLTLATGLDWQTVRVRPWMAVDTGTVTVRANLGVYLPDTPVTVAGHTPSRWDVTGYDLCHLLDTPVGATYSVPAGTGALAAAATAVAQVGETVGWVDLGDDVALPTGRTWPVAEDVTWRRIVNDLLGMAGRQGVWCDWNGTFRSQPYQSPTDRASEWTYRADVPTLRTVSTHVELERDWFAVPNVWVGIRQDDTDQGPPVEGDGIVTVVNQSDGPTSIDARAGRVVRHVATIDAASQTSLAAQLQQTVDADLSLPSRVTFETAPNPLHWHFDVVDLVVPELGLSGRWLGHEWELPLDGQNMRHLMKAV